jgi:voltage-gated potassium channel
MFLAQLVRLLRKAKASRRLSFSAVAILLGVAIFGNAICFYVFDGAGNDEITFGDSLWYSIISITTIGYGDLSATTTGARLGTILFVIVIGLSAFSIFFSILIDSTIDIVLMGERGMGKSYASGHTLIVHFPSASRVEQLVREIQSDHSHHEVVIISDQIERLPFKHKDVVFIHGSSLSEDTYLRARADEAGHAIVLATSYDDANSDAIVASAVSVLDSIKSDIHIVAECLDDTHRKLFKAVRCDAVISGLRITGNLLVQEAQDPGVSQTFDIITSNLTGDTLFSTQVESSGGSYGQYVKKLLDADVNVLSVVRGDETFTSFSKINTEVKDRIVYLASQRQTWTQLKSLAEGT